MSKCKTAKELQTRALEGTLEDIGGSYSNIQGYSGTGFGGGRYNPGRWAIREIFSATNLIEETSPLPEETMEQYAGRLLEKLRTLKKNYYDDPDDEDGFGAGALESFISTIEMHLK